MVFIMVKFFFWRIDLIVVCLYLMSWMRVICNRMIGGNNIIVFISFKVRLVCNFCMLKFRLIGLVVKWKYS